MVMCVICTCYIYPFLTSFVSDTVKAIKGPVTRAPHKPTYDEQMSFLASVDICRNALYARMIL